MLHISGSSLCVESAVVSCWDLWQESSVILQFTLRFSFWHIDECTQQMVLLCYITPVWRKENIRTNLCVQEGIHLKPKDLVLL